MLNLANYLLKYLTQDDVDQWEQLVASVYSGDIANPKTVISGLRESDAQLERRQTFSSILLCQMYNAFDIYTARILKQLSGNDFSRERLEIRREELYKRYGLSLFKSGADYKHALMIRSCRNLITHNHGVVDRSFHDRYPKLSQGIDKRLKVYSEEVGQYMDFLLESCFRLDKSAIKKYNLDQKKFAEWTGPYMNLEELYGSEAS